MLTLTGDRIARCGHTYQGPVSGAPRRRCRPDCPAKVPRLVKPGRPSLGGRVLHTVYVHPWQADVITDRTPRPGGRAAAIRALLAEGAAYRAEHPDQAARFDATPPVPRAREAVTLDAELTRIVGDLEARAVTAGVPAEWVTSVVVRALLCDAVNASE